MIETKPREVPTSKPRQRISWSSKRADNFEFFKATADYYIRKGSMLDRSAQMSIKERFGIYNNKFPPRLFKHVLDPLSAKKAEHRNFGAKIRPTGILRTNLDLLMGEYPRRPFVYQVSNLGEDGYNSFTNSLSKGLQNNLTQHFIASVQQEAQQAGVPVNQIPQPDEIQLPDSFVKKFKSSYKDNIAIKGQKWLKRAIKEFAIRPEQFKMFKDYLISGYAYSYKGVERSTLQYKRISPTELSYDPYDGNEYLEDKEWIVRRYKMNISDVVDNFYDEIKNSQLKDIEEGYLRTPEEFFSYFAASSSIFGTGDLIDVYHVVWKGKKKKGILYYPDELTGEIQSKEVDEEDTADASKGESIEWFWANEFYETTRLSRDIYLRTRPVPIQRNEMNNLSTCKGPYNGRAFSATESENISVQDIGMPFQIMHMIISYILEKTINKSKGKILMIDKATIPRGDGWDDEKFFYYADSLGYALLDRAQLGVDKTMNQYHVLDMTLFDSIAQLITLQDKIKQQWDDILGITRQRKGQTYASDSVTNNQAATFQSTVITDSIYSGFEEFIEKEFQGLLDLSKFTNIDGVRKIYNNDDFDLELLEIDANEYTNASLGIMFTSSVKEQERFEAFKNNLQAMVQNGTKNSTVLDILMSDSIAELKQKLKQVEDIEAQIAQQLEEQKGKDQAAMAEAADEREMHMEEFRHGLKKDLENLTWDRKDENEMIKGEYKVSSPAEDSAEEGATTAVPNPDEMVKRVNERMKMLNEDRNAREKISAENIRQLRDLTFKYTELATKEKIEKAKNKTALKNKVVGQK